jgi:hypothetical protein
MQICEKYLQINKHLAFFISSKIIFFPSMSAFYTNDQGTRYKICGRSGKEIFLETRNRKKKNYPFHRWKARGRGSFCNVVIIAIAFH